MKRYLREIELAGMLLLAIGLVFSFIWGIGIGMWPCGVGILLWLVMFLYKAFHWQEYERENKQNIVIVIATTIMLIAHMIIVNH